MSAQQQQKFKFQKEVIKNCSAIVSFFQKDNGFMLCASKDNHFMSIIDRTFKVIGIDNNLLCLCEHEDFPQKLQKVILSGKTPLSIVDYDTDTKMSAQILRELRERDKELPVIVLLKTENYNIQAFLSELEYTNIIYKPAIVNSLAILVSDVLSRPSPEVLMYQTAYRLARNRQLDRAVEIALATIRANPENIKNYLVAGDMYLERDDYENAERMYLEVMGRKPDNVLSYVRMAKYYKKLNDKENEIEILLKLEGMSPLNGQRKMRLAQLYFEKDQLDDAVEYLNNVVNLLDNGLKRDFNKFLCDITEACVLNGIDLPLVL